MEENKSIRGVILSSDRKNVIVFYDDKKYENINVEHLKNLKNFTVSIRKDEVKK